MADSLSSTSSSSDTDNFLNNLITKSQINLYIAMSLTFNIILLQIVTLMMLKIKLVYETKLFKNISPRVINIKKLLIYYFRNIISTYL